MRRSIWEKIREILKKHVLHGKWVRTVIALACIVTFITTYLLIMPAVTLSRAADCGQEEHTHTEDCYETETELTCGQEEHTHTEDCYDEEGNLTCGMEEHTHDDGCYTSREVLVCGREEHVHTEDCYAEEEVIQEDIQEEAEEGFVSENEEEQPEQPQAGDTVMEEAGTAAPEQLSQIRFRDYLTDWTTLYYAPEDGDSWQPLAEDKWHSLYKDNWGIRRGDTADRGLDPEEYVLLHIGYRIPAGQINTTNPEVEFILPLSIRMTEEEVRYNNKYYYSLFSGTDREADQLFVDGEYEIKEEWNSDGEVTLRKLVITFNEDACLRCGGEKLTDGTETLAAEELEGFFELRVKAEDLLTLEKKTESAYVLAWNDEEDLDTIIRFDPEKLAAYYGEKDTADAENTEAEPEPEGPASGELRTEGEDYAITVSYTEEAGLPADVSLKVKEITRKKEYESYKAQMEEELIDPESTKVTGARFFDITLEDSEGNELHPESGVRVLIETKDTLQENEKVQICHFDEEKDKPVEVESREVTGETYEEENLGVEFEAESFSVYGIVYTVDFTWEVDGKTFEYSLPGGGAVCLSDLAEILGITSSDVERSFVLDVESVEFSDSSLLWVGKVDEACTVEELKIAVGAETQSSADLSENEIQDINSRVIEAGDWALISLLPFTSEESLTVAMKSGEVFAVRVTDAQITNTVITAEGDTYRITVTYGDEAGVPEGAKLDAFEITSSADEADGVDAASQSDDGLSGQSDDASSDDSALLSYEEYAALAEQALGLEEGSASSVRLFDIRIVDEYGEKVEIQAPVDVKIELAGAVSEDNTTNIVHFADNAVPEVIEIETNTDSAPIGDAETNALSFGDEMSHTVCFEAEGFSVYAVVDGPSPAEPVEYRTVSTLEELAQNCGNDSFKMSLIVNNTLNYIQSTLNGSGAFVEDTKIVGSADWIFEPVDGQQNQYRISTKVNGATVYMKQDLNSQLQNSMMWTDSAADASVFVASSNGDGTFRFMVAGTDKYLQHSGGGKGVRLWSGIGSPVTNSQITLTYASSTRLPDDPYGLDGTEYGLMNYKGGTYGNAIMSSAASSTLLAGKSLLVRTDPMDPSNHLYVAKNSDISTWKFQKVESDRYYLTCGDQYVKITGSGISMTDTPDDNCVIQVIPGSGANAGKVRFVGVQANKAISSLSGSNFGAANPSDSNNNQWFNLVERSVLEESDFVPYSATKVSVSDQVNVPNGAQVVIYTRKWNETTKSYEFFVIDHNGKLVPAFESGDSIVWIGASINTMLWDFTEYYYEGTTNPNFYYDLQNTYSGKYLAPLVTGDQILTDSPMGINLTGRRYGDYYTPILAWDDPYYDYASVVTENGEVASAPMAQAEQFYFAVINPVTPGDPTKVATVDHEALGLTLKMVDFNGRIISGGGSNYSPTTEEQLTVMGTREYSVEEVQYGLLSTNLPDGAYPVATNTLHSLRELFDVPDAVTANHLFIQSIYDSSGYFEFDSTRNFADLNGNKFDVYQELGTVSTTGDTRRHGQFMPYNTLDMSHASTTNPYNLTDIYGKPLSDDNPRKYEELYGFTEADDHYFGMEIEGHFMQTANGNDAWGHDLIFEFVGDDDFWLYVDGELVIDLGGIHKALPGSVNYNTGEVIINGKSTTLRDIFASNYSKRGMTQDEIDQKLNEIFVPKIINGQTHYVFKDYSSHSVRIFYMERGGGASNLRMRFNLATVTPGQVLLEKKVTGTDKQDYTSVKFPFQIYTQEADPDDNPGTEPPEQLLALVGSDDTGWNVVYQNTSIPVEYVESAVIDGVTYEHVFYLKPGQVAAINVPDNTWKYRIRECGVSSTIYDTVQVNDETVEPETSAGGSHTNCYSTTSAGIEDRAKVIFGNHVDPDSLRTLSVTKRLFDAAGREMPASEDDTGFRFRIYLGEKLDYYRKGDYHVKDPNGYYCKYENGQGFVPVTTATMNYSELTEEQKQSVTFQTSPSGAVDKIPAKYTVEVRDLLVDTKFKVTEESYDIPLGYGMRTWTEGTKNYTGYKRVEGSYFVEPGIPENSGTIRDNSDPHLEVHNQRGWGIRAEKSWTDKDFILSHGDAYFAVYIGDSPETEELLPGSVRKIDDYNYINYYFDELQPETEFSQYHIREVVLTNPREDANGNIIYDSLQKLSDGDPTDTVTISGNKKQDGTVVNNLQYYASYAQGEVSSSSGNLQNIRTDSVTNTRLGGLKIVKQDMEGHGRADAVFTLTDRSNQKLVGSYTSLADGSVTTLYLPDGEYEWKETKAPAGYKAVTGTLIIGVENGVYSVTEAQSSGSGNTGSEGAGSEGAGSGEAASEGATQYSGFDRENGILTIQNEPYILKVRKIGSGKAPLPGVHFALYRQVQGRKDYTPLEGYEDLVSREEDGILLDLEGVLEDGMQILPAGTYYLVETQTVESYTMLTSDVLFSVTETGVVIMENHPNAVLEETTTPEETIEYTITITNLPPAVRVILKKAGIDNTDPEPAPVPLPGAKFTIYTTEDTSAESDIAEDAAGNKLKDLISAGSDGSGDEPGGGEAAEGVFFDGWLKPGTYYLEETDVPAGYYGPPGRYKLTITSAEDAPTITATWVTGNENAQQGTVTGNGTDGFTVTLQNTKGYALPKTGGPGTRLFTILGSILILGAGVLLWRRRRFI